MWVATSNLDSSPSQIVTALSMDMQKGRLSLPIVDYNSLFSTIAHRGSGGTGVDLVARKPRAARIHGAR